MLGTHNSWSYNKPKCFWLRPFWFTAKCQDLNIREQYTLGSRVFDLRVWFNKYGKPEVRHGIMSFVNNFHADLSFLNRKEDCYVRVILESNKFPKDFSRQKVLFFRFCSDLQAMYPDIKFFGGEGKWNWEKLFHFKNEDVPLIDKYSSTTSIFKSGRFRIIDDWYPRFYAKKFNRRNYEAYKESEDDRCLFIDFINYVINSNK